MRSDEPIEPIPFWKRAFTSNVGILLAAVAAVAFTVRGVSLIVHADQKQAELLSLSALVERFDALEGAIHEFELGITPSEFLSGLESEDEIWRRVLAEYRRNVQDVRDVDQGLPLVETTLREVEEQVTRLSELRGRVLDTRSRSGDVTVGAVRYHQTMDHAGVRVRAAVSQLRSQSNEIAIDLAASWKQLSYLVWISCLVAVLAAVLSALYRRDLARRQRAEAELARVHSELEQRVEERTAELSLANTMLVEQIRERKKVEERLQRFADRLSRSNSELQEFAYVASHDLQEPLRMVASYVQLLSRRYKGRLDTDADEFISFAVSGAERMKRLIQDLLTYARVDAQEKAFEGVDCAGVMQDVLQNLKVAIEESRAEVTCSALPRVSADPTQITQLLQNLVVNAIKFRGDDPPRIHVSVETSPTEHLFRVRDNGVGIDPAHFERIFRVFQRLEPSDDSGTGIGLAICKKIVERHGGRIWVQSTPGRGTSIFFTLPVQAQVVPVGKAETPAQRRTAVVEATAPAVPRREGATGRGRS